MKHHLIIIILVVCAIVCAQSAPASISEDEENPLDNEIEPRTTLIEPKTVPVDSFALTRRLINFILRAGSFTLSLLPSQPVQPNIEYVQLLLDAGEKSQRRAKRHITVEFNLPEHRSSIDRTNVHALDKKDGDEMHEESLDKYDDDVDVYARRKRDDGKTRRRPPWRKSRFVVVGEVHDVVQDGGITTTTERLTIVYPEPPQNATTTTSTTTTAALMSTEDAVAPAASEHITTIVASEAPPPPPLNLHKITHDAPNGLFINLKHDPRIIVTVPQYRQFGELNATIARVLRHIQSRHRHSSAPQYVFVVVRKRRANNPQRYRRLVAGFDGALRSFRRLMPQLHGFENRPHFTIPAYRKPQIIPASIDNDLVAEDDDGDEETAESNRIEVVADGGVYDGFHLLPLFERSKHFGDEEGRSRATSNQSTRRFHNNPTTSSTLQHEAVDVETVSGKPVTVPFRTLPHYDKYEEFGRQQHQQQRHRGDIPSTDDDVDPIRSVTTLHQGAVRLPHDDVDPAIRQWLENIKFSNNHHLISVESADQFPLEYANKPLFFDRRPTVAYNSYGIPIVRRQ